MKIKEKSKSRTGQIIEVRSNGTKRVYVENTDPDMAQQQYQDMCCVNKIMERHEKGIVITHLNNNPGVYSELGTPIDLMEAQNRVIKAREAFMALPASLRSQCNHDPVEFLKMLEDPANDELFIKHGVKNKKAETVITVPQPSDSAVVSPSNPSNPSIP